ncbi:MAG: folylpolyglutamate synthase/dihydrofolate synthase family protein [Archangium sp.]|nr:folylpolyglutamate synthase/dihydrofolate synthase family protein [Archangium sp.]MDP3570901.1 folylpolyglutamate synthase/dihydrofolate synthase family protein [Archangium sp.]
MGLDRVRLALDRLGNPEQRFPALHVAGTNGKGSTCAIAASCLGTRYHTGLYTSPHLIRPNERIQIDGVEIDDETFGRRIAEVVEVLGAQHDLTYFEFGTVVAFWHFAQEKVEIAVLETGLGGRLDATTACVPAVTCITPIDFDHQEYLGHTLTAIASEKAGIGKPQVPLISSRQHPEALAVLEHAAGERLVLEGRDFEVKQCVGGKVMFSSKTTEETEFVLPLKGPHQLQNLAVALACLEALTTFPLSPRELRAGVSAVRWPGRLEEFPGAPLVVLDGAHNPAGAQALLRALVSDYAGRPVHLVFGVFADKDFEPMMRALFPRVDALYLTPVPSPRSKAPQTYEALAKALNPRVASYPDAEAALHAARAAAPQDGLVVVAGSLLLVGHLRRVLLGLPR